VNWLIYGANGYTGELIAREAVRRGQHPILAGRDAAKIEPLARELGCDWRAFPLEDIRLDGVSLVLHCAGPFIRTSKPMVEACIAAGAHYLDITGEIGVFESILHRRDVPVTLLPGVGFDVVPTDCLAAFLAERLPDANDLMLAFRMKGSDISRGTMKTMIESIGESGAIRRDGKIMRVRAAYDVREIAFSCGTRAAMTIPWGDVSTAYHTTGIPNVRVYMAMHPSRIKMMRRFGALLRLLSPKPIRRALQAVANRRSGPDETQRSAGRVYLWGQASNARGQSVKMTMTTPEGYAFTAMSAVNAVERVLAAPKPGAWTPAKLLGADFVTSVPGVFIDA